jgi:hypothetical protein
MMHFRSNLCSDPKVSAPALTFPAILDDPMVRTLMQADHVDPLTLRTDLSKIAATITVRAVSEPSRLWPASVCG